MPEYTITFARSARKELEALGEPLASRVFARVEALASDPRPAGCRKLRGSHDLWRVRVGDYRVVYSVSDATRTVDVSVIRHRSDVYR